MSTRFKNDSRKNYQQTPLPSGYENSNGVPDIAIPSCGIEDVDVGIFNLFDKEISAQYGGIDSAAMKKVPVIFAAGEKWAMLKRGRLLRDKNNTLLLPLITIMRTEINQTVSEDVVGRGINQQLGELTVHRRLDKSDRNYQNLINRLLLPNQEGLSESKPGSSVYTDRPTGQLKTEKFVKDGAYLTPNRTNNVYETIVVPMPQFYTAKYEITVWTQYTQHTNQIIEKIFSSFLPQAQSWKIETNKGYWFVAKVDDGSFTVETNFEDMSQQERFIKNTFSVTVPAYFFATSAPGAPVPIKRYVSSPMIYFEASTVDMSNADEEDKYILGSDDPTLPLDLQQNNRPDQRSVGWRQQKVYPVLQDVNDPVADSEDPASKTLPRGHSVKVVSTNSKGETVFSGAHLDGLEIVVTK
jgi:hypothetical protein